MHRSSRHALIVLIGLAGLLIVAACGAPEPPTPTSFDLTVAVTGDGTGIVTSDVGDITVTTGDDAVTTSFDEGTTVTLTAAPAAGSVFAGWTGGDCDGTATINCEITLDADTTVTATFGETATETFDLEVAVTGTGTGTVTSDVGDISVTSGDDAVTTTFDEGTTVTLTAAPEDGSTFTGWTGDCSGTGTCEITLDADATVTATFGETATETFDLEVAVTGTGTGTVTSDVGDISVTSGDDAVTTTFDEGTTVTLTAAPEDGSTFTGWTGDCSGTGTCEITLDADATVTATFGVETPDTATLTVATSGSGTGDVTSSPDGIDLDAGEDSFDYNVGTLVTLTATADDGFAFGGWSGGGCSGTGTCVVEVTDAVTVTADFFDPAADVTTDTFVIAQGSDDAEEFLSDFTNPGGFEEGGTTLTSSDLDLTYDVDFDVKVAVGLRYAGVDLPNNAVVTSATITFTRFAGSTNPGSVTLDFVGQASDDAPTFVGGSANFDITNRDTTTAAIEWPWTDPWTPTTATSPNLASIVSEVLQRDGWSSGNALAFIITSDDSDASNYRRAISYETAPENAPVLSITYYVPTAP